MENVLVINAGSSSLKYQLINMEDASVLAKGIAERIGIEGSKLTYKAGGKKIEFKEPMADHTTAIDLMLKALQDAENGVLKNVNEIKAVGHRVVHGGEEFGETVLIDDEVIKKIEDLSDLAPLHNPANLMGIRACRQLMPKTPMGVTFDTAFHQTMPPEAYIYGLPYEDYEEYRIRRYGFHGTSHSYVSKRMAEILNKPVEELKIVTCHLGNGSSISAVKNGKSIDTSMGFTPLEGPMMGTRCGSIDPAIVGYLADKKGFDFAQIDQYMNKKSGVDGLSGVSSDFRDLNDAMNAGNERARLALYAFGYQVKRYIGAYVAAMNGVDALVFTAGVGENDEVIRDVVLSDMDFFGVDYNRDVNMNAPRGEEVELTKPGSKTTAWIIPTNEELVIAEETYELIK